MKIVTFNMRMACKEDGENYFFNRLPLIVKKINQRKPDIICAQEITDEMRLPLSAALPDYGMVGAGRNPNRLGEGVVTLFRKDTLAISSFETLWLSSHPNTPGSIYENSDQSDCPRVLTTALLVPTDGCLPPFRVYNLHTDHVGADARMRASRDLLDKIRADLAASPMPYMAMGDFNATPDSPEMRLLSESTSPVLRDVTESFVTTFHNFGRKKEPFKINYIFLSPEWKNDEALLWTEKENGVYLSDHYPIEVTVKM